MINDDKITPNRSKTYLLPLLSAFYVVPNSITHLLRNTYVSDEENLYRNCMYLLFEYDPYNPDFMKFEYELTKTKGFVAHYDLKNNMTLYVLEFPQEYLKDYYHYLSGKYSLFRKESKIRINRYLMARKIHYSIVLKVQQVFDKDPGLRSVLEDWVGESIHPDAELGEAFDKEKETININKNIVNHYETKI